MFKFVNITKVLEKSSGNFLFKNITLFYYKKIVKNEIALVNINENNKILCIGGGYFPATAMLFSKYTNAKVVVIDNDIDTINYAKKRIEKMKLDIDVIYIDGQEVDVSNYDFVHIANQVSPKNEVLTYIEKYLTKGKILVRTPKGNLKKGYEYEKLPLTNKFIKQPFYSNIDRTLLYEV